MEQKRKLKVYTKCPRIVKGFNPNPEIRLTGKWVKEWGFCCGNMIIVKNIANGAITIVNKTNTPPIIKI